MNYTGLANVELLTLTIKKKKVVNTTHTLRPYPFYLF